MNDFISKGSKKGVVGPDIPQVGKREHKKAVTKLQIMETFLEAMEHTPLDSLRIEDLCKSIGISKVTFFNYFSSKEQIIEYYIYRWQYDISYMMKQGKLQGVNGIKHVYHTVSDHKAGLNIMTTLMKFYLSHHDFERMEVTPYELYLFNSEAYLQGTPFLDLPDIFQSLLHTINEPRPIPQEKIRPTVLNLASGFYGVSFVMHIADTANGEEARENLKKAYDRFVDSILWGV